MLRIFRKKAQYKKHALVWRLRRRELGGKLDRRNYYQNLPLNGTIGKVSLDSQVTLKRFSPDGRYLIGFNHYAIELFAFNGADAACRTHRQLREKREHLDQLAESHRNQAIRYHEYEQRAREMTKDIQKEAWSTSFAHVKSIPVSVTGNGEEMIREFCLFLNGYCIVASSTPVDLRHVLPEEQSQSNETLGIAHMHTHGRREIMPYENYTLYSIDLERQCLVDEIRFKTDRIALMNNQGVTCFDDRLAIVQLHQQQIKIVKLTPSGNFEHIATVGYVLQPSDLFLLDYHPEYREKHRYQLSALTSFKQCLLGFFYRTLPRVIFYKNFNHFNDLKFWKSMFVDKDHLLIKMARESLVADAEFRLDSQNRLKLVSEHAMFLLYNIPSGQILSACENSSANLYDVLLNFQNYLEQRTNPLTPAGLRLCSKESRAAKERYRTQLQRAQYGSRIDAIRRIMWNWPPPAQGISQSPYLKCDLFSFNEVHIGPVEIKLRPMSSNPVKFFCRCCQSLCFEIQSANSNKESGFVSN